MRLVQLLRSTYEPRPDSLVIWRFKHSNAIEIRDGINFDFYMGLPHASFEIGLQSRQMGCLLHEVVGGAPEGRA